MATIIENNDVTPGRSVLMSQDDSGAGWAVAILVLVVVLVAGAFWYMRYRAPAAGGTPGATVQVNLPTSGYAPTNTGSSGGTQTSGSAQTQTTQTTPAPATSPTTR